MTHQVHIAKVIASVLNNDLETVDAFCRGNPFDKLIRSFDERNDAGNPLYKNLRGLWHYRMSVNALNYAQNCARMPDCDPFTSNGDRHLYGEHLIPISLLIKQLKRMKELAGKNDKLNTQQILDTLQQSEVVLVTKAEQKDVDQDYRSTLPESNENRLEAVGIEIATLNAPRGLDQNSPARPSQVWRGYVMEEL